MNYSSAINEFIQNQCSEDLEVDKLLKEIDIVHYENNDLEQQLEESEHENVRLQMELYNLKSITSQYDKDAIENSRQANMKVFEASVDLRNLIKKIDFVKILQCNYMEMEAKCRKECEPMQERMARTAEWHTKMEQRHIVQRYRQAELAIKEAENAYQKQQESMKRSLKESSELINNARDKRIEIIVNLIKGSKLELEIFKEELEQLEKYGNDMEEVKQQKMDLMKQLELTQHKAFNFNPILPYKSSQNSSNKFSQNLETYGNIGMPKFPSFSDILNSFQTANAEITVIENTTIRKSILRNSHNNSMELNQSITTKLTKQVHFKVPLEEYKEVQNNADEMDSETSSESSQQTTIAVEEINEEEIIEETEEINNETQMETIDLLTPAENKVNQQTIEKEDIEEDIESPTKTENVEENLATIKPKIDIQEVIIFKAPLPVVKDHKIPDKENIPTTYNTLKNASSDESSSFPLIQKTRKTSSSSFYDEFLESSFSSDISPNTSSQSKTKTHTKRSILKDFDTYLNENKDFLFSSESKEIKDRSDDRSAETKLNVKPKTVMADTEEETDEIEQDIIDFGSGNDKGGFTFDSSDEGGNSRSDLDFLFR